MTEQLEWIVLTGAVISILLVLAGLVFLVLWIKSKQGKLIGLTVTSLLLGGLLLGGTFYLQHYESTTLNKEDTENITTGYYLINELEQEMTTFGPDSDKKAESNIQTLAVNISSLTNQRGNGRNNEEAQLLLNRYYKQTGQLGINLAAQNMEQLKESEATRHEFLEDIAKIKEQQISIMTYFKINDRSIK